MPKKRYTAKKHVAPATWSQLIHDAVHTPGILSTCFQHFHRFSVGNQLLAWCQCRARGIPMGPLATFKQWKKMGRTVTSGKGSAILLTMPITVPPKDDDPDARAKTFFVVKPRWFVLAQTDGPEIPDDTPPDFDMDRALTALNITQREYDGDGNAQGYSTSSREIAVSPLAEHRFRTIVHEIAHIELDHFSGRGTGEGAPKTLVEAEAEMVSYIVSDTFGQSGADESRGYIQRWYGKGHELPEASARQVMKISQRIIDAGTVVPAS
jgi:hypothetical protein